MKMIAWRSVTRLCYAEPNVEQRWVARAARRFAAIAATTAVSAVLCGAAQAESLWVHPLSKPLPIPANEIGPFLVLKDGSLALINKHGMRTSADEGKTWSPHLYIRNQGVRGIGAEPAATSIVLTKSNALVIVYCGGRTYKFSWDNDTGNPREDCRLEMWSIRSLDGGKTWIDAQKLLDGYNPNFFGLIQTRTGRLVAAVPHTVSDPGRYVACSLTSDDDGKTWKRSDFIDIGGSGHHSGAMEPTVAELSDGRLLMLIRTERGRFWEAISEDGGLSWPIVRASQIESTSAPGYLLRLASGRLALVYNGRPQPHPKAREELAITFSEDDGKSWTRPIPIARLTGGQLSYPFFLERRPGELWIIAGFSYAKPSGQALPSPVSLAISEGDLIRESKSGEAQPEKDK